MTASHELLRLELAPVTGLEEMFFDQIVNLATLASYLMKHLIADPELLHKESPRRMRMLSANQRQARYAYEELRRLQRARLMQEQDPELADVPILAIVARNSNRPRVTAAPTTAPIVRPVTPGRNAACPCNSGRKYKHCCSNMPVAA